MKKISLLLVGLLVMFSCEQEDLEGIVESDAGQIETRAVASSIADFNPISELAGIPVNILNIGNTKNKYLSAESSGTKVKLVAKDDNSARQHWYLSGSNSPSIKLVGGNSSFSGSFIVPHNSFEPDYPWLVKEPSFGTLTVHAFVDLPNNCYNIYPPAMGSGPIVLRYLQSDSQSGSGLIYKTDNTSLAQWEIAAVGEYELVDLEYVYTSVDNFNPTEIICDRDTYENQSSSVVTWNYTVTTRYTESSNFSKTEGVSVSISNGLSVGLPSVAGSPSIGMNTTMQQQTSKSWTYGNSNTKEITKTRTGNIPVQPHTTMKLEAVVFMYEGTVTYVATLRKIGDTKTFRVKGKWEGACFSDFKARTYDVATNKLLNTYSLK
uniref:hypothetical protein n=1 Tax=uncultured Bacteroides sp. TaxID=162156 RepID=UPI00280A84C4|nr:hypothetical protein [uncultured Bacteroides sp.]